MKEQILDEVLARRFLLGQLPPDEQGRIEELAFEDPQSFAFLQAAEDDLIDEFVYDDLSPEEKERFQNHFLVQPGRRHDLRIARALRQHFDKEPSAPSLWERLRQSFHFAPTPVPAVVVSALIIAAIIGLILLVRALLKESPTPPVQVQQQQPAALPTPTSRGSETSVQPSVSPRPKENQNQPPSSPQRSTAPVYAVLLTPGGPVRSGGGDTPVPFRTGSVVLELPLIGNTPYRSYEAALEKDGKTIDTWPRLKPTRIRSGKGITVPVSFDLLEVSARYRIVLKGTASNGNVEHVGEYYFHVTN